MKRKILGFLLVLVMAVGFLPTVALADAPATSGTCGENMTWAFDDDTGTLTISGISNMYDYSNMDGYSPWYIFRDDILKVIISEGVKSIGDCAFDDCNNLEYITIPLSVTEIGTMAFNSCENLLSITIPEGVVTISAWAFCSCSSLEKVILSNNTTFIGGRAFFGCSNLKSIDIPGSVKTICDEAFSFCSSLTSITIPDSVTSISDSAFSYCSNLSSITLPKSILSIGYYAFDGCEINDVYYGGTEFSKKEMFIADGNESLLCANWIYEHEESFEPYPEPEIKPEEKPTPQPQPQPQPTPQPEQKPIYNTTQIFTDVAKDWYTQYVDYAYSYGIFKGNENGTFKPLNNITRAEFVQVLANITGVDTSNKQITTKFNDVVAGDWFAPAVKWANDNGIVAGKYANQFAPEENITREQMCVMIVNYAKFKGITLNVVESKEAFVDDSAISSWAKDAVYACQMADIVNGKGGGRFDPQGTGLRAEACVIFTKFHQGYLN